MQLNSLATRSLLNVRRPDVQVSSGLCGERQYLIKEDHWLWTQERT